MLWEKIDKGAAGSGGMRGENGYISICIKRHTAYYIADSVRVSAEEEGISGGKLV